MKKERELKRVEVRLTEKDYLELNLRAANHHMSVSAYIRRTVFEERFKRIHTDYDTIKTYKQLNADLNRLGNMMLATTMHKTIGNNTSRVIKQTVDETLNLLNQIMKVIKTEMKGIGRSQQEIILNEE